MATRCTKHCGAPRAPSRRCRSLRGSGQPQAGRAGDALTPLIATLTGGTLPSVAGAMSNQDLVLLPGTGWSLLAGSDWVNWEPSAYVTVQCTIMLCSAAAP